MGTLHYGLRGSKSNDDGTFTEQEMDVVAGLGLGFLSGATGVGHIGAGEKGYTAPWVVTPEEAQARFEIFKILDPQAWEELKTHGPGGTGGIGEGKLECWERLLDIDFLENLEKKEWSTNWGNWSTEEFVYKMGYKFGFERIANFKQGYFRKFIPIHSEHRWHRDGMEKVKRTIVMLNLQTNGRKLEDEEVEDWFTELQTDAWNYLQQRFTPNSMVSERDYNYCEVAGYYGVFDVKIDEKTNRLTIKERLEEEHEN